MITTIIIDNKPTTSISRWTLFHSFLSITAKQDRTAVLRQRHFQSTKSLMSRLGPVALARLKHPMEQAVILCAHDQYQRSRAADVCERGGREGKGGQSSLLGLIHCHFWRGCGSKKPAWHCAQQSCCGAWVTAHHYCCAPFELPFQQPCQMPFQLHMLSPEAAFLPSELPFQRAFVGSCPAWGRQHLCPGGTCGPNPECCAMHHFGCCAVQVSHCCSLYTPTPAEGRMRAEPEPF